MTNKDSRIPIVEDLLCGWDVDVVTVSSLAERIVKALDDDYDRRFTEALRKEMNDPSA